MRRSRVITGESQGQAGGLDHFKDCCIPQIVPPRWGLHSLLKPSHRFAVG